jgi:beta-glucosidase
MAQDGSFAFPEGFLWGAATSSHQVEGGNSRNDWWEWEQLGKAKEKSGDACRHYELYANDFDLARSLGHNAHRFSIEWSRVEPEPGRWDESAIAHYRDVLKALRDRGMTSVVTLHHFTNPLWFARLGGWKSEESLYHFERYTHKVVTTLGEDVGHWITINEPLVLVYQGYLTREWPPGEHSPASVLRVFRHMLLAHQRAYTVIHAVAGARGWKKPSVGFAQHLAFNAPCAFWSPVDRFSTFVRNLFFFHLPFEALIHGYLLLPGFYCEKLPFKKTLDFIGVNYYTREFIHFAGTGFPEIMGNACSLDHHREVASRDTMGWESYPEGLHRVLVDLKRFRLPVMITENGTCTDDDRNRWDFILGHVRMVAKAIQAGVPVLGYLYWSLLDNFEWARGFRPRFGLVEMDYVTQKRKVRESAWQYAEICRSNRVATPEN